MVCEVSACGGNRCCGVVLGSGYTVGWCGSVVVLIFGGKESNGKGKDYWSGGILRWKLGHRFYLGYGTR